MGRLPSSFHAARLTAPFLIGWFLRRQGTSLWPQVGRWRQWPSSCGRSWTPQRHSLCGWVKLVRWGAADWTARKGAGLASMVNHWGLQTKSRDPSDHPLQLPPRSKPLGKIRVVLDKLIHPLNRQQLRPESGMARLTAAIAATVFASLAGACSP